MEAALKDIPLRLSVRPRGILVVSGHWEESEFSISSSPKPGMVYDYYGFPEHTYRLTYPAPGSPVVARRVREVLAAAEIASDEEPENCRLPRPRQCHS